MASASPPSEPREKRNSMLQRTGSLPTSTEEQLRQDVKEQKNNVELAEAEAERVRESLQEEVENEQANVMDCKLKIAELERLVESNELEDEVHFSEHLVLLLVSLHQLLTPRESACLACAAHFWLLM